MNIRQQQQVMHCSKEESRMWDASRSTVLQLHQGIEAHDITVKKV